MYADLRPAFPTGLSVCLGGGGATGFQFKEQTQAVEFPQVQASHEITSFHHWYMYMGRKLHAICG